MQKYFSTNPSDFVHPSTITRLLVISYFIALALNLVQGADVKILATPFMSDPAAHLTMRSVVLFLSAMILFGLYRRTASLVLSLVVFWPSYMTLYAGGDVSAFWRDLALIGGLLMSAGGNTYVQIEADDDHGAEDHTLEMEVEEPMPTPAEPIDDGVYREDLNLARSV